MHVPTISKAPELAALLEADSHYSLRYEQCLNDIEAAKSIEALKHRSSLGNLSTSYMKEWNYDIQLAELLSKLSGKTVKADTVKKRRLRGKTTADQFAMEGEVYESGSDPASDWQFPSSVAPKFAVLYRNHHRKGETPISFFIRWLSTVEIPRLDQIMFSDALTLKEKYELDRARTKADHAFRQARATLKAFEVARVRAVFEDTIYQGASWDD